MSKLRFSVHLGASYIWIFIYINNKINVFSKNTSLFSFSLIILWLNVCTYLNIVCTATIVLQSASESSSAEFESSLFTTTTFSDNVIPARSKSSKLQSQNALLSQTFYGRDSKIHLKTN